MSIQGSCLCGTVRYALDAPLLTMFHCHCSRCRKHHGAPFVTFGVAPASSLRWLQGRETLVAGDAPPGMPRHFCGTCGSPAPTVVDEKDVVFVPVGTLDDDPGLLPTGHMFTSSKAAWYEISDALPQHARYAPEAGDLQALPDPVFTPDAEGRTTGSCLCGSVHFAMRKPVAMFQCHCQRCRKARGAAHGANLFCRIEDFTWLKGEEQVVDYKLPAARYFAVAFCGQCGSSMPRVSAERGIVVIPVSALDSDPGMRPMAHIFTGSKASWFEITDQLTQHVEGPPAAQAPPR